ncbi:MAG: cytochrome c nitrite reductase small subunit [Armatimonadetes bacterium]|nr:cytochrome c nitrite reductase small subunit [Armatimonadota bacterium]
MRSAVLWAYRYFLGWLRALTPVTRFAVFGASGALVGMFPYLARISEGASYMSDSPETCINCHIMNPEYASWERSSHGRVTVCNDCHVPHDNIAAKYFFKAKDGSRHSYLFTLRREQQVIQAIPESRHVIQKNCLHCHERIVDVTYGPHADSERSCTDCHREVPHGREHSLTSSPNAAVPSLSPVAPDWLVPGN